MKEPLLKVIRCPKCHKPLQEFEQFSEIENTTLFCEKGHTWTVENGIPSLVHPRIDEKDAKWISDYDQMAENYDEMVKLYDEWLGIDMMKERERFAQFIPIEGPSKIMDVSVGTAANFIALYNRFQGKQMGRFNLHGLDLSKGMLHVAKKKLSERKISCTLVHGSVFNIPYRDNSFDIVLHSGGINTFSDISMALEEMMRIAEPEGIVIVTDEGLSPQARETPRGKDIIKTNSLFASRPPLEHMPERARNLEVRYIMNDTFYQIMFKK
jgi:ubiquinone/menaquinone biosynthesis C-methylase UbiE